MMKRLWLLMLTIGLLSCEDTITPTLPEAPSLLAVEAWINNKPEPQVIRLTQTQPYFDGTPPPAVSDAVVTVSGSDQVYTFVEDEREPGTYYWTPSNTTETLGTVGSTYQLTIESNGETYTSTTTMDRVAPIDSITFEYQAASQFFPETYVAEFWAVDPAGEGDAYWIRTYKNGELLDGPDDISLGYDAGFTQGGNFDDAIFIQPVRTSINPFDQDEDGDFLAAYLPGDSVYVELHSISDAAFNYWNEVQIQVNRPGGFGELFASPIANVPTNIVNTDPEGPPVVGFFNVAAVSGLGKRLF